MIRKLVSAVAIILAFAGGLYAGDIMRAGSAAKTATQDHAADAAVVSDTDASHADADVAAAKTPPGNGGSHAAPDAEMSYYRFPTQFFVPVMHGDRLDGMMVLTLSVEMPADLQEEVFKKEFRLRDAFLRTLLIHANTGGFDGNFTIEPRMRRLREALMATATEVSEHMVTDVLIEDIARQDAT
ncbi:MAG: flagellar basal body-associated FliL family protein [Paracoccus denitrificans]|uniref:Flagellar basal body-associated FliL family protein n=1 Tax=Paracoccus denitrificans TaxID=266 RepID=A0A533I683_PARDE|nr:MAG: flagellar basal body-associated FliL family protein [Paracoccus denitrificans]